MAKNFDQKKIMTKLKSKFGDEVVMTLSDRPAIEAISTGSKGIDYIIGPYCPGFPLGKLSQIYGSESSGKSLLCCQLLCEAQRMGLMTVLVDRENHYTKEWYERFGGKSKEIIDVHPETIEDCMELILQVCKLMKEDGQYGGLFVIDSLQSLPTRKQYDEDTGVGEGLAASARYLSSKLSGIVNKMREVGLAVVTVGQIRTNPDPYAKRDKREYTPGGNALSHYSVLRIKMLWKGVLTETEGSEEYRVGFVSELETIKNDVGGMAPRKVLELEFYDGSGAEDTQALFSIARHLGLVQNKGAWFYVGDEKFQGKGGWKQFIKDKPELYKEILGKMFDPKIVLRHEAESITDRDNDTALSPKEDN